MIVPDLTRAAADGRLTAEFVSYASALLAIALPPTAIDLRAVAASSATC